MPSLIIEAFTIIIIVKESGRYTYMQACMSTCKSVCIEIKWFAVSDLQ